MFSVALILCLDTIRKDIIEKQDKESVQPLDNYFQDNICLVLWV